MVNKRLVELNRRLAAVVNAHVHWDLKGIPELERLVLIADLESQIAEALDIEWTQWVESHVSNV